MNELLFCQLTKAHESTGEWEGIASSTAVDKDGEAARPWDKLKQAFIDWAKKTYQRTRGKSWGNIRSQHVKNAEPIGILTEPPKFDDRTQTVHVKGRVFGDEQKDKLANGVYGGLSIGGSYADKSVAPDGTKTYVPVITELSLCDVPCNDDAVLTVTRADGTTLQKAFVNKRFSFGKSKQTNRNERIATRWCR